MDVGDRIESMDARLLNEFQRDFPLVEAPFAHIAERLGSNEAEVIAALDQLQRGGSISRVGTVFAPGRIGASTLAALAAPPQRLEEIAALVSRHAEVNHNYEREHRYNLWFVVAAADEARVAAVLREIEEHTGCTPVSLPLLQEFHVDLGFDLGSGAKHCAAPRDAGEHGRYALAPAEARLLAALEPGMELVPRPYAKLAQAAGIDQATVLSIIGRWLRFGVAKRLGVVVRHRELGYSANAMVVWDVPDTQVSAYGAKLARVPEVTLCYRRARALPDWRYNLFCMVHGRDRRIVEAAIARFEAELPGLAGYPRVILFSRRRFKQTGARYASATTTVPPGAALPANNTFNLPAGAAALDATDRAIVNRLQGGFPICDEPYAEAAQTLGLRAEELIARLAHMMAAGVLTRFGPMYQTERIGGAFVLAALAAPEAEFERVAAAVNAHPEVAHNYRREHALNMWFVLATETPQGIAPAIARIEHDTGILVYPFPKEREFFVGLRLSA